MQKLALLLLLGLPGVSLFAQSDRGTITGHIVDPSSSAVPNATVNAVNQATGIKYSSVTNAAGNYAISQLPFGRYDVSVEATGFRRLVRKDIPISVGQTVTLDATLEIGQVDQTLEVTSAPPLVESTTSDVGTAITTRNIMDLPLAIGGNMRNPESFIFLTPGVTATDPNNPTNTQINGSPSRGKEILFDGASASSPESGGTLFTYPSVEAIGEFKLLNTNYSAQYGRTGGGFEIFTTKSGTNDIHGSVFEYLRNDAFDARGFFARTTPINRQNEFGAVLGGPVVIPHVYNGHNRTFFNVVYSGFRFRAGATNELFTIPPVAFRQGDFSKLVDRNGKLIQIYDPATTRVENGVLKRDPFPGNKIPENRFSAVSKAILASLPTPTNNNLTNNFLSVGAQQFDRDQVDIKIDHALSDRNRLSGFFYYNTQTNTDPTRIPVPFSGGLAEDRPSYWLRLNHDFIFSPTTLNNLILGFTREGQYWAKLSANQDWPTQIGLQGVNTGPGNTFPMVTFSDGYTTWGDTSATTSASKSVGEQINNVYQISDNLTHIRGNHQFKFGGDYRWQQTNGADFFNSQGRFDFRSMETASVVSSQRATSGNAFASFLLGTVDAARYNVLAVVPSIRYKYLAGFVQDDWKVSRRLTLNLGLRYDIFFPRYEAHDNMSGFDPTLPNPGAGNLPGAIAFLGDGTGRTGRRSFADTDYKNFGPRIGFAYSLNDKTVFRGGYGISYAPGNAAAGLRQSQGFGFGFNAAPTWASTDAGVTPAFNWDNGLPTNYAQPPFISPTVANGFSVSYMGRDDGRPPYFQNFTFEVQRELPASIVLDAAYVGVKGTRLGTYLINVNELNPQYLSLGQLLTRNISDPAVVAAGFTLPYPGFKGTLAQALRPYPQYLDIISRSNPNGNSTYHALQTKIEKRFSHGLSLLGAYTFSKTISDADMIAGLGPGGQTYYNRSLEKAISTNDIPHNFALSYVYELPFGPGKPFLNTHGVVGHVVGGWTVTGIHQYYSGRPIVLTANNTLPASSPNNVLRPDVVPGVPRTLANDSFDPAVDRQINLAAFTVPTAYRYGTAARSYTDLRSDPFLNESFAAIKRTALTERVTLTFRAEFFNAFNRVVFAAPDGNISNATFGKVSKQYNTPRQGQLALRVDW